MAAVFYIKQNFNWTSNMRKYSQIIQEKLFFMVMTSSMMSQGGFKFGPLHSLIDEIRTHFVITSKRASINLLYMFMLGLWLYLYKFVFITSLTTSSGPKIDHNYLRWYFSFNIDLMLKVSEMVRLLCSYIQLTVSLPVKTVCCDFKMAAIW